MNETNKRILAIDYGQARIGLAQSDSLGISAQPLKVIERKTDLLAIEEIRNVIQESGAAEIILGLPRNMDGSLGPQAQRIHDFADLMKDEIPGIEIVLWDERLTTVQSEREMADSGLSRKKRKNQIDKIAATLLLQNYLDFKSNQRERETANSEFNSEPEAEPDSESAV